MVIVARITTLYRAVQLLRLLCISGFITLPRIVWRRGRWTGASRWGPDGEGYATVSQLWSRTSLAKTPLVVCSPRYLSHPLVQQKKGLPIGDSYISTAFKQIDCSFVPPNCLVGPAIFHSYQNCDLEMPTQSGRVHQASCAHCIAVFFAIDRSVAVEIPSSL